MKIYFYNYLVLLLCLFALSSCEEESQQGVKGAFTISLVDDLTGMVVTKSTPSELGTPLASKFNLQIKNASTGVNYYDDFCDKTYYEVAPATYDLLASYGTNPTLAFDSPYYKGELANQTVGTSGKNVVIPCSVANALVSVKYTNQTIFDAIFISYGIVATAGDQSLNWPSESAQKSVYLKAGSSVSFVFKGILKAGSQEVTFPITQGLPETYKAKDHYTLRLTYQAGQSKLDITTEKKEATINETVPQDWLPKPSTESTDFANKVLTMKETMNPNAIINLKVARPLQDLKFKLEFEDPTLLSLNKEYTLSSLSEQDKEALTKAGILLPSIGSSEPTINMNGLTGKLQTTNGGQTVNNYISINPKANNRWNAEEGANWERYTVMVEKPEFRAEVYPGDIWTKEFSITPIITAGNEEKIITGITYEYSIDKQNWQPVTDKNVVRTLTPNSTYSVRAIYRDIISESIETKTYAQITIPNAGLDEGWQTTNPKKNNPLYTPNGGWWSTRNPLTCHTDGANVSYVSKSGTIPVTDNGRNVAWLMTLGWGSGNSCDFGQKRNSVINNISSGALCIGTFDNGNNSFSGIATSTRPTALSFSYKSSSYKDDKYEVSIVLENLTDGVYTTIGYVVEQQNESVTDYKIKTLSINYDDSKKSLPITHLKVLFKSGTIEDNRDYLEDKFRDASFPYSNAFIIGSQLWVDSISLIYDK